MTSPPSAPKPLATDLERVLECYDLVRKDCMPGPWLGERMAVGSERLDLWEREGLIFSITLPREAGSFYPRLYPTWQFDVYGRKPREAMERVVAEARRLGLSDVALFLAFKRRPGLVVKGQEPVACLRQGRVEEVLVAVRHQAALEAARRAPSGAV